MGLNKDVVVVATKNPGKAAEFKGLFAKLNKEIKSLLDVPQIADVIEDGETFSANALKKAKTVALELGVPVLADDSGLCVDWLDGRPGVYSARYAGSGATDALNNEKLLSDLSSLSKQKAEVVTLSHGAEVVLLSPARFVCVLAYYDPNTDTTLYAEGECLGHIASEPRGTGGFGYDPLFFIRELGCTMAELTAEQKNQISHRAKALEHLEVLLADMLQQMNES